MPRSDNVSDGAFNTFLKANQACESARLRARDDLLNQRAEIDRKLKVLGGGKVEKPEGKKCGKCGAIGHNARSCKEPKT